jgi:hypothetical protein
MMMSPPHRNNLQDLGIPLYLAAHSKPVWHERPYQQLLQLWLINWNGEVNSPFYQNMLRPNTSYKIMPEHTWLVTISFKQKQVTKVSKNTHLVHEEWNFLWTDCFVLQIIPTLLNPYCTHCASHEQHSSSPLLLFVKMWDTSYQNVKPEHSECIINVPDAPLFLTNMASLLFFLLTSNR